jgi:flagellar biosynthesis/type III secretory pathway protein FliH
MKIGKRKGGEKVEENKAQLNVLVPKELKKDLDWYATRMDAKIKDVVIEALQQFLQNKPQKQD